MKVIGYANSENIHISHFSFEGLGSCERVVAIYRVPTNVLEIVGGCAKFLPKILKALRKFQRKHNMPISPIKVEYW